MARTGWGIFCLSPIEYSAIDNEPGDGIAMPAKKFGRGMNNNICAPFERTDQIGRCQSIVDNQRHASLFSDV